MATRKTVTRAPAKKMTEAQDMRADAKAGIKEGSARDSRLDRSRGLPPDTKKGKGKK